ncbi:phosphatase [Hyphobacterium sp. CCMP332]|nr:phosphatase [Hyphobacterium sp. CCMP332]
MKAFIDLGTNTFHCKIVSFEDTGFNEIYYHKIFVKIGEGISKNILTAKAIQRAKIALMYFQEKIEFYEVKEVLAVGTSALRNANNKHELVDQMKDWNWNVEIIGGEREAELIFKGILLDSKIPDSQVSLTMDIGGGSVEFIIADQDKIKWSQSFEIGAQRLKDQYHSEDPINNNNIKALFEYLETILKPLKIAIQNYQPQILIGSSGTFDTLLSISRQTEKTRDNFLKNSDFLKINHTFINSNLSQRLKIKGMVRDRAEMIVTASLLVDFVLKILPVVGFYVSSNSLKEGLIYEEIQLIKANGKAI